jgi:hypothetical protein
MILRADSPGTTAGASIAKNKRRTETMFNKALKVSRAGGDYDASCGRGSCSPPALASSVVRQPSIPLDSSSTCISNTGSMWGECAAGNTFLHSKHQFLCATWNCSRIPWCQSMPPCCLLYLANTFPTLPLLKTDVPHVKAQQSARAEQDGRLVPGIKRKWA